jgi:hypothetical protein
MDTKNEIEKEYDEMMGKIDSWEAGLEDAADDRYSDIKNKRNAVRSMWEEVKDTADDAWDGVKSGMRKALDELKEAYDSITA